MFATEDIDAGELILAERPLLIKMVLNPARCQPDLNQEEMLRAVCITLH